MVILSKISNAVSPTNQRPAVRQADSASISFVSQRHSSEFLARLTSGAKSITRRAQRSLVNAIGRDFADAESAWSP